MATVKAAKTSCKTGKKTGLPLPGEDLLRIYRSMVMTRVIDERGMMLQRQGRIGFFIPCTGQEAAQVGMAQGITGKDWMFPSYRNTGAAIHRGANLRDLVAQLFGNGMDRVKGRQMPNHFSFRDIHFVSISSPIGTQITHAVGAAMAAKYRKDPVVTLTDFGDGSTSASDFHAGMNFAGVYKAPVIFLCQNNQWAISLPLADQTACAQIAEKAKAYGFEGVRVDGNDVLAVSEAVKAAADKARNGGGPTLVEAVTYRVGPHSSSDNPRAYRAEAEVDPWKKRDPILRMRAQLEAWRIWSAKEEEAAWAAAREDLARVVQEVEKGPALTADTLFTDVYATMPPNLAAQKAELDEELKERGGMGHGEGAFPL